MSNFICGGALFLVSFAAYQQAKIIKKVGNKGQAIALILVSVLCGVGAIVNLLGALLGG